MNLSELAQHLDLAISTVSRVLSGNAEKYRISKATTQRILEAAEKHNVIPDPLGASLRKGSLGMIGLLVPDITNPFFSHLARSIELELRDADIAVQLCDSNEEAETEARLCRKLLARRLDGLIIAPVGVDTRGLSDIILQSRMPVVAIDRVLPELQVPSVSINNFEAGKIAAEHMMASGHQQIACLRGNTESHSDEERYLGIREAIIEAGHSEKNLIVEGTGYGHEASLKGAQKILDHPTPPSALITLSGQGILSVLKATTERDLKIPDDLSIIAFDEQPWSPFMSPPLTTIAQPVTEMASEAVRFLKSAMRGESVPDQKTLSATLCERQSVKIR